MAFVGNGGSASPLNASQIPDLSATYDTAAAETTRNTFSAAEVNTGQKWIDGKTIYRKVVDTGALPNTATKTTAHGLTGTFQIVRMYGIAYNPTLNLTIPLPYAGITANTGIALNVGTTVVNVSTGVTDYVGWTSSYVVLEYTKG